MRKGIRIITCGALAAIALTMAVFTFSGISRPGQSVSSPAAGTYYVLGERDGNVAVFRHGDCDNPVTVTNIELEQLRQADRSMIRSGLITGSEQDIARVLEDLGS